MIPSLVQGLVNPLLSGSTQAPPPQVMPTGQPTPQNPYDAMVQQRINAVRSQMEQEAMQSAQQEAALFDMLRQQASQMAPTPQLPQQAQFDPRMRDYATALQFAGIFGNARPQFTQGAVQNVLQSGEQRKTEQNQRYNLEAQQKGLQAQNEYQRDQRVGGVNAAQAQSQLEATMGRQKTAQGELSTLQKQLEEERTARRDQQFKVDLLGQKFEGQTGLETLKGTLRTTLAKLNTPAAKKQGLIEIMQPFLEQVRTGAMSKEDFQWLFADEYETLMSGDAKAAQAKKILDLLPEEKRLMGAKATYYEKLPGILQDRMTVDQWKTMVGAELRMSEGLAAGPEGVKALEDAANTLLGIVTDRRKELTDLRKEQSQLDPKDAEGIKAYAEAIAKKQNEIREGEAAYNQAKERVTESKKARPITSLPKAPAQSGRNPQVTSRGSTDNHSAFRNKLASAFPGAKVEQFSGTNRNMRGAGTTNKPSRHNDGRALDSYYKDEAQKQKMADWAIANGATFIIDYAGKRNWKKGQGWYPAPNNDPSYKHLHIEID